MKCVQILCELDLFDASNIAISEVLAIFAWQLFQHLYCLKVLHTEHETNILLNGIEGDCVISLLGFQFQQTIKEDFFRDLEEYPLLNAHVLIEYAEMTNNDELLQAVKSQYKAELEAENNE